MDQAEPVDDARRDRGDGQAASPLVRDVRDWLSHVDAAPGAEPLSVRVWLEPDQLCVIALAGELDMNSAATFRRAVDGRFGRGSWYLIVEVSQLTFIDSTGIHELVRVAKEVNGGGGTIVLSAPAAIVARVLEIVRLAEIVAIEASLEVALAKRTEAAG